MGQFREVVVAQDVRQSLGSRLVGINVRVGIHQHERVEFCKQSLSKLE